MIPKAMFQAFAALVFLLFIFVTALILGGCKPEFGAESADEIGATIKAGGLRYATDPSTGHCFAYAWITSAGGFGGAVITWVPCS